jgi:hypothetical protein
MTKLFVPAYWPLFKTHELRRFDYRSDSLAPFTSIFSYDVGSDSMLYNNYDPQGAWLNKWYYQYRTGFGIAEWRDDYPNNKKVVMSPPIGWGEFQDVGSDFVNYPKFNPLQSWPPATGSGVQIVHFEDHLTSFTAASVTYTDVIQFTYLQSWGGKAATGARYWMALGVGPVAVQFLTQGSAGGSSITETGRWDAVVTRINA